MIAGMTDMSSLIKRPAGTTQTASDHALDSVPGSAPVSAVEASLNRMDALNRQLGEAALRGGEGSGARIVGLRYDFTTECGTLLLAMCEDERIFGDRTLFVEMQTALDDLRTRFGNHQLRWQGAKIEADPAGYRQATRGIEETVVAFVADARAALG
jgi:hypothetical protein